MSHPSIPPLTILWASNWPCLPNSLKLLTFIEDWWIRLVLVRNKWGVYYLDPLWSPKLSMSESEGSRDRQLMPVNIVASWCHKIYLCVLQDPVYLCCFFPFIPSQNHSNTYRRRTLSHTSVDDFQHFLCKCNPHNHFPQPTFWEWMQNSDIMTLTFGAISVLLIYGCCWWRNAEHWLCRQIWDCFICRWNL